MAPGEPLLAAERLTKRYGKVMHGLDERRFAPVDHLGFWATIVTTVVVFGGFLWLSIRRLRRMDVP